MPRGKGIKPVAQNRKARHDFFIDETLETGIALVGTEVKSIRGGKVNLKDSFCRIKNGELYALGVHISPYEQGNIFNRDPFRERKLLAHKAEIRRLQAKVMRDGYSLVPLSMYFKDGKVKLEIALAKGKKLYDKRTDLAKKDAKMDIDRAMRGK